MGRPRRAFACLRAERARRSDELDDAVAGFLAPPLTGSAEREAAGLTIGALAPHLPRYHRSLARYAADIRQSAAAERRIRA